MLSSGSHRLLLSAFQTVGPITANAWRPYVSSCILGTTSRPNEGAVIRRLGRPACTSRTGSLALWYEDIQSLNVTWSAILMMELSQIAVIFLCAAHRLCCGIRSNLPAPPIQCQVSDRLVKVDKASRRTLHWQRMHDRRDSNQQKWWLGAKTVVLTEFYRFCLASLHIVQNWCKCISIRLCGLGLNDCYRLQEDHSMIQTDNALHMSSIFWVNPFGIVHEIYRSIRIILVDLQIGTLQNKCSVFASTVLNLFYRCKPTST